MHKFESRLAAFGWARILLTRSTRRPQAETNRRGSYRIVKTLEYKIAKLLQCQSRFRNGARQTRSIREALAWRGSTQNTILKPDPIKNPPLANQQAGFFDGIKISRHSPDSDSAAIAPHLHFPALDYCAHAQCDPGSRVRYRLSHRRHRSRMPRNSSASD